MSRFTLLQMCNKLWFSALALINSVLFISPIWLIFSKDIHNIYWCKNQCKNTNKGSGLMSGTLYCICFKSLMFFTVRFADFSTSLSKHAVTSWTNHSLMYSPFTERIAANFKLFCFDVTALIQSQAEKVYFVCFSTESPDFPQCPRSLLLSRKDSRERTHFEMLLFFFSGLISAKHFDLTLHCSISGCVNLGKKKKKILLSFAALSAELNLSVPALHQ